MRFIRRSQIDEMVDWYPLDVLINNTIELYPHEDVPELTNVTVLTVGLNDGVTNGKVAYFGAPEYYLGEYY